MKIFKQEKNHLFCGHWNGSPVEIGVGRLKAVPPDEALHYHDYHEYYIVLGGHAKLNTEGKEYKLEANTVIMVEPSEKHEVTWVDPARGCEWIIVKQNSIPDSKILAAQ
ncbi:MAG: cupin domain-containing protein [Candidatus Adiutricales bacterium]|jgi:hypothetical protein